jgi:parallel beta-helix repeat protein
MGIHFAYGPLDGITPQDNLVSQNRISGFSKGIQLGAVNTPVLNNSIMQNSITHNSLYGIFLTNASYTHIENNTLSANGYYGIYLTDQVLGNLVVNNLIGTDESGLIALPNGRDGIRIQTPYFSNWWNMPVQQNNLTTITGNIISGNSQSGIHLAANTTNNIIQDNWIGLAMDQSPLGNGCNGITIEAASYNLIGGAPLSGTKLLGNWIAYNSGAGLAIDPETSGNVAIANTIWGNGTP